MDSLGITPLISSTLLLITFIWMLFTSFKRGVLWGILILFFSPISTIVFAYSHWDVAKKPVVAFMVAFIFHLYIVTNLFSSIVGGDMVDTMSEVQEIAEQRQRGEMTEQEAKQKIEEMLGNIAGRIDSSAKKHGIPGQLNNNNSAPDKDQVLKGLERITGTIPGKRTADDEMVSTLKNEQSHSIPSSPTAQKSDDEALQKLFGRKEKPDREQLSNQAREAKAIHSKLIPRKKKSHNRKPIAYDDLTRFMDEKLDVHLSDERMQQGVLSKVTKDHIELYRILSGGRFTFEIERNKIKHIFISQHQKR